MIKTKEILQAEPIAVRNLREDLFRIVKKHKSYLVTTGGERKMFLIPYEDMVELIEILEESKDAALRQEIERARREYRETGGTPYKE